MHRDLTVRLDEDTIRKAKIVAARRSTSVTQLVAAAIDRLGREDEAYEQAYEQALADLESGFDLGSYGRLPARDEAHAAELP